MKHHNRNDRSTRRKLASLLVILGLASGFVAASIRAHNTVHAAAVAIAPVSHASTRPSNQIASRPHDCVLLLSAVPAPRPHRRTAAHQSIGLGSQPVHPQTGCPNGHPTAVLVSHE
jgi:hypothetical protein